MSAQPKPQLVKLPAYAQLREQNNLLRAELQVVRRERDLIRTELLGLQRLLQE